MPFLTFAKNGSSALPPTTAMLTPSASAAEAVRARTDAISTDFRESFGNVIVASPPSCRQFRRILVLGSLGCCETPPIAAPFGCGRYRPEFALHLAFSRVRL